MRIQAMIQPITLVFLTLALGVGLYVQQDRLWAFGFQQWQQMGWYTIPLGLLALLLAWTFLQLLSGRPPNDPSICRSIDLVIFLGPTVGMLGTVDGLRESASIFYSADGIEELLQSVKALLHGVSRALDTTYFGGWLLAVAGATKIGFKIDDWMEARRNREKPARRYTARARPKTQESGQKVDLEAGRAAPVS